MWKSGNEYLILNMKQPSISGTWKCGNVEMWKSGNEYLILNMKQLSISGSMEMWKCGNLAMNT